jgi:hypothetical protein
MTKYCVFCCNIFVTKQFAVENLKKKYFLLKFDITSRVFSENFAETLVFIIEPSVILTSLFSGFCTD